MTDQIEATQRPFDPHHGEAYGAIQTGSGLLDSRAAIAQVATLPLLILLWGVGMVVFWQFI